MLNQQIHNYKIITLLGEGGMANVYLVEHLTLGQNYALKLLKDEFVQHPNIRKRFLAEARNLAKMQHSNVIKVTDLIDAGDIVAFVMEYIEGVSLEDFISTHAPLSPETIEKLFLQMVDAVEYVHSQGLIHRDIKPTNFMVTPDESVKLLDFGIAKNLNDGAVDYTKTSMAQQMGTPMYMSPEQVRNTAEITRHTDIYSLGVVLWQMVTNKKPYDSERLTLPEIQVAIMKEPLPLTNTGWDEIIEDLTEKNSLNRGSKLFIIDTLTKITAINELWDEKWDELDNGETSDPAEIVYEKELKEIEKAADEVAQNRQKREKKMQALSAASTTIINQKYIWIGAIILIALVAFIYLNQKATLNPVEKEGVNDNLNDSQSIDNNKKEKKSVDSTDESVTKLDQINKQSIPVQTNSSKLTIGQEFQGGIIFYIDQSGKHGKICTTNSIGEFDWDDAKYECETLSLNEYSDWYLPTKEDLNLLCSNKKTFTRFSNSKVWSSTINALDDNYAWGNDLNYCSGEIWHVSNRASTFAIRKF